MRKGTSSKSFPCPVWVPVWFHVSTEIAISAIGDAIRLRAALNIDPGVRAFRDAATAFGLGYEVTNVPVIAPAYSGSGTLDYATAIG